MNVADFLYDPARHLPGDLDRDWPLAFIDLDTCTQTDLAGSLPPVPVIGLGDPGHPLAPSLDCIVEPPVSAEGVLRAVRQAPHAAAVAVELLRAVDGVPSERALVLEGLAYGLLQGSSEHRAWLNATRGSRKPAPAGRVMIERDAARLIITLDRPDALNAIDQVMRDQLFDAFTVAASDPAIGAVELRSVGPAFSIGGDIGEFGTTLDPATAHLIRRRTLPANAIVCVADRLEAHVQGPCVGAGLEMAAFAGRLTARANAWFQLPELAMGVIPGAGGCVSVPRRIGRQRAALMILSARRIGASTALDWGLVDAIEDHAAANDSGTDSFGG